METEPWKMVNHLFPDLVFLVEGKKLYYHQAVIAQHSELVRNILLKNNCCRCGGADCSRNAGNIFISLDGVKINTVQYVMEMIYAGSGSIAGDTEDYKNVLEMLQINTIVVDALDSLEGFVLEEILHQVGNDLDLDMMQDMLQGQSASINKVAENENSKKDDGDLKETNKAIKRLEREKKRLESTEEKKKIETERKRDLRPKNKKQSNTSEKDASSRNELKNDVAKSVEGEHAKIESTSKANSSSSVAPESLDLEKPKKNPESTAGSKKVDDDCEIITLDSSETIGNVTVAKSSEIERYVCPFTDCHSESKNVQSIKVHLALVHYKKLIQSEFPNWKKQKCDECEKSFGQMTAYYLHMANHKKYQYMDLPAHAMIHKEIMPVKSAEPSIPTTAKSNNSKRNPIIKTSNQAIMSKPAVITKAPPSTTNRNDAEIIPSSGTHVRSSSHTQSSGGRVMTTKGHDFVGPSLKRSKSFVQPNKTLPHSAFPSKPNPSATQSGSRSSIGGAFGSSLGRTAPPGPPGPGPSISSATITRSNSFHKVPSSTSAATSYNKSTPITSHQRRLSAPYSVVTTKRAGSKEGPLASKDSKKSRGS